MSNKLKPLDYCTKSPLVNRKSILAVDDLQRNEIIAVINKMILTDDYNILNNLSDDYITSIYKLIKPINKIVAVKLSYLNNTKPHRPDSTNTTSSVTLRRRASLPMYYTLPKIDENKVNEFKDENRRKSFSGIPNEDSKQKNVKRVGIKDVTINFDLILKKKRSLIKIIKSFVLIEKEIVNINNRCEKKQYVWFNHFLSLKLLAKHQTIYTYKYSVVMREDNELIDKTVYKLKELDVLDIIFHNDGNCDNNKISLIDIPNLKDKIIVNSIQKNMNLENTLNKIEIIEELVACLLSPLKYDDILLDHLRDRMPSKVAELLDQIDITFT